jgi:hypothetical protein
VQNTNEIPSHYLLYEARDRKLLKSLNVYMHLETAKLLKKICMKLKHHLATENRRVLKTVYKRLEAEQIKKYEAQGEEATEKRTQQQCILSGGVYLRHHSGKVSFQKSICSPFPTEILGLAPRYM